MSDLYPKKVEAEPKIPRATCRPKGMPEGTPERQHLAAIDMALA